MRKQTIATAGFYIVLSLIGLIVGFVVVSSPESFTPEEEQSLQVLVRKEDQEFAKEYWYFKLNLSNTTESDLHLENRSLERNHFHQTRAHLIREGIEMVFGSLINIALSVFVIYGVVKSRSMWLMPWLVIQIVEIVIGGGFFLVNIMSGANISVSGTLSMLIIFMLCGYMTYTVMSYYMVMRRQSKHSANIISSVMEGNSYGMGSGVNYEQLSRNVNTSSPQEDRSFPNPMAHRSGVNQTTFRNEDLPYFSI